MSRIYMLAADHSLPVCDNQELRTHEYKHVATAFPAGFKVEELVYYRQAAADLGYAMKNFQYEISLEENEIDLQNLRTYLAENFSPGEVFELWSVWVGDVNQKSPPHYRGNFCDFDMDTLKQFLSAKEICLTITV